MGGVCKLLEETFGKVARAGSLREAVEEMPALQGKLAIPREGMQTAIAIGCSTILPKKEEYMALYVANMLLGGYFGSKLMKLLREDRGYTYGIHSRLMPMRHATTFCITTETKREDAPKAVEAIYEVLRKLQEERVDEGSLASLKSYLEGHLLFGFDGPLMVVDRMRKVYLQQLDFSYYQRLHDTIQAIDGAKIQAMLAKHLPITKLSEVTVGL